MPNSTFFNISKQKRDKIVLAAMEEFARHPYEQASLSRIVSRLQIAKGSMYQYFDDKRDLYLFIIDQVYDVKREYLRDVFSGKRDFFDLVKLYYQRSYLFSREYPMHHQIIRNFWESRDEKLQSQITANKELRASDFSVLLTKACQNGTVNPDLCGEPAFFVYHSVGKELIDSFQNLAAGEIEEHLAFIDRVLDVLRLGLATRS